MPSVAAGLFASRRLEWLFLGVILLVAAAARLYRLDTVPPGLTHDEAGNGQAGIGVLEGEWPLYLTIGNGQEALYSYSMAPVMALLGRTEIAVRCTTVLWGLALILVTWAWARRAFDPLVACLTAAGLGVGFWPLMVSRLGLRAITLPALFTAAVYCFWPAISNAASAPQSGAYRMPWRRIFLIGLLLGGTFYTYMASRVLPAVWLLFWLYLVLFHRQRARPVGLSILVALALAVALALPLIQYLRTHPGVETRIEQLDEPLRQARAGDWESLRQNLVAALKLFSFEGAGDPHWIYNLSGRPLLDPVSSLLFYAGLLLALWRWRDPAHAFALIWLAVGMTPVLITGANSSVIRAVAAQPPVFLLQALALRELVVRLTHPRLRVARYLLPAALLLVIALISLHDYFDRWPNERDVRVAYHTTLVEIARYLDAQPETGTATISSI